MSDYQQHQDVSRGSLSRAREIDQGLRAYMMQVYNYMMAGVALTGVVAYGIFYMAGTNPAFAQLMYNSPLKWVVMFAPLAMVFFLSARMHKMSFSGAQIAFWVFAALMGASLSWIFLRYGGTSIARVFFISAAAFGALSVYGYVTKKDLSGWGTFLFMGLIGIIIASIVNIFVASSALQFAISVIGVLVFAGLTAYDTQRIKEAYYVGHSAETLGKLAIMGALSLYLDFINLFMSLLSLFGSSD
ncbi:MAG: Bax inhibitor-1/YccA family protein [Rhizobiales bacterium]|nr:Bax inhibitor-1/YccA family protein [Hyphomicrobiales bacterium]